MVVDSKTGQMKCPRCGAGGCTGTYYDWIVDREVTEFWCDDFAADHFLIIQLPPTEEETLEEHLSSAPSTKGENDENRS